MAESSILWNQKVDLSGDPPYFHGIAAEIVTPGDLVQVDPATGQVQPHATAAGVQAAALFALTNTVVGKGLTDTYAIGETVYYCACKPGDIVQALVKASSVITPGTRLESAGNGQLQVQTTGAAVAESLENETTGVGQVGHIRVRIVS